MKRIKLVLWVSAGARRVVAAGRHAAARAFTYFSFRSVFVQLSGVIAIGR
jgi:hypothetical protein